MHKLAGDVTCPRGHTSQSIRVGKQRREERLGLPTLVWGILSSTVDVVLLLFAFFLS
jgi:hypothetical protein